jgi:hypothetical protein
MAGLLTYVATVVVPGRADASTVPPPSGCTAQMNPVQCENLQPGTAIANGPLSIPYNSIGDPTIQGFGTSMSVNVGQSIYFKVNAPNVSAWHVNIFRLGYYQGLGSREWASNILPSVSLPQSQPPCEVNPGGGQPTGLIDCGNWAVSASWQVPSYAVSGLYMALLVRNDTGGTSEVPFVVRNDASTAQIVYQTSDATWEAYNAYNPPGVSNPQGSGIDQGNSLYQCYIGCPAGTPGGYTTTQTQSWAVSYNRPLQDGDIDQGRDGPFYAEFPMIQFLEQNGYDVTYMSETDTDSNPSLLTSHKMFISNGHDEYWSANMRNNVTAARNAGVNLAFFSGNEVFWKTQYGPSPVDGTLQRSLISYKETHNEPPYGTAANQYDPNDPPTWTGSWRDPQGAASGGDSPENQLTGQYFTVNSAPQANDIQVPYQYAKLQLWQNTAVAKLTSTSSPVTLGTNLGSLGNLGAGLGTLGYEWDVDADNGFRPAGEFDMSSTTVTNTSAFVNDYGINPTNNATSETHHLTLYRASSGALVFGSGTVQWSWGLNNNNPDQMGQGPSDPNMQQFTVNLLAAMGAQPTTLMSGLVAASAPTDTTPPTSAITSPTSGQVLSDGAPTTIAGTATDSGGGVVAGVEVSTDGGHTWHPATSMSQAATTVTWSYSWQGAHGAPSAVIESRATDDRGNVETPSHAVTVSINCGSGCSIWGTGYVPATPDNGGTNPVTVGVKFTSDTFGTVAGIKFYKSAKNTGTQVGQLWTTSGQLLATANFNPTTETSTGWQSVSFATPVPINPNTTYVASYFAPAGHTAEDDGALEPNPLPAGTPSNADSSPLHAVRNTSTTPNAVIATGSGSPSFPTLGDVNPGGNNYAVDVAFLPQPAPGPVAVVTATAGYSSASLTWSAPSTGGPVTTYTITPYIGSVAQTPTTITGTPAPTTGTVIGLTNGTSYTFTVTASNPAGTAAASPPSNAVTPSTNAPPVFVQQVSAHASSVSASTGISVTPGSNLTAGNRLVVEVATYSGSGATASSVTDSAGDTFSELKQFSATDKTQMSIWTAPVVNGGGTKPTITAKASAAADVGIAALEYQGLSTASGTTVLDQSATNSGTTSGAGTVQSGATATTSGSNELAMGFYADSGFDDNVGSGSGYSSRVDVSPTGDVELLVEDQVLTAVGTANASATTGANTTWLMGTVVLKSEAMTPATVPAAPSNVIATAGNGSAIVTWTAPDNGGSLISSYTITPFIGSAAQSPLTVSNAPPVTSAYIGALTPGTAYTFTVTATNAIGNGPASAASNSVTPTALTAPSPPTGVTATAGNTTAAVSWTAPTNNGGSPITSYTVTPNLFGNEGSSQLPSTTVTGTTATITGLTNGTAYTFTVTATSAIGTSQPSVQSNAVTPATSPGPSLGVTASPGDGTAAVSWSPPASNGGSGITSYTVTPYIGSSPQTALNVTVAGTATSATVIGLTDGTAYTFTVVATNALGAGPSSAASNSVTPDPPPAAPGPPTAVTATAGVGTVTVGWTAPSNGGSPITRYTVTPYVGSTALTATVVSGSPPVTSTTFSNLTDGTAYTFTVTATNVVGTGPSSNATGLATPEASAPACPCTIFGASTPATPDSGDGNSVDLGVAFTVDQPGYLDGIRFYKSAANIGTHVGDLWTSTGGNLGQVTFSNETASGWQQAMFLTPVAVTPGVTYVASYLAPSGHYAVAGAALATANIDSPPLYALATTTTPDGLYVYGGSAAFPTSSYNASNYYVDAIFTQNPLMVPSAPTGVTALPANNSAVVSWTGPTNNGGEPVSSYTVTPYVGSTALTPTVVSGSPPATSVTVSGLTNGTAYTFTVAATNAVGQGAASSPSSSVTPEPAVTAPGTPTGVVATAGLNSVTVSWTAPNNGGSTITSYAVTPYLGSTAQTPTVISGSPAAVSAAISGLTNGKTYTFTVLATNAMGSGAASVPSNPASPESSTPTCPCTIFGSSNPAMLDSGEASAVNLGVAFTADVNGYIAGVRFYKASTNTGTHVGNLWSATGSRLAQATFTNETASGWQQVYFSSPVAVTAGSTYVASYLAPNGHYSATSQAFLAGGIDLPPLHALANSVTPDGLYLYGTTPAFPANSYNETNYSVDVIFTLAPPTVPAAPTGVSATGGNASATVSWTAPANGNSSITSYTVTPYIGSTAQPTTTVTGNPAPATATVTGLTNGTAYTLTVTATNAVGTSVASGPSNAVTPSNLTVPGAPTAVSATAGNASATVSWTAPANGNSTITSYTVTPYIGSTAQPTTTVTGNPAPTTATVTGLTNGTPYTFTVTATNAIGSGPPSAASNVVTPIAPTPPAAPTGVTATAGNGSVSLTWTAPANGGGTITSYTVTPSSGTPVTVTGSPAPANATVTGLVNGTTYTFTVTATNSAGTSAASGPSNPATPLASTLACPCTIFGSSTPSVVDSGDSGAVNLGVAFSSDSSGYIAGVRFYKSAANTGTHVGSLWSASGALLAQATFTNETASGWQQIIFSNPVAVTVGTTYVASYLDPNGRYSATPGAFTSEVDSAPLHALASGAIGNGLYAYGAASTFPTNTYNSTNYWVDPIFTHTPVTPPLAPAGVTASAGAGSVQVSWTAPANGNSTITSYTVTPYIGSAAQATTTVTGNPAPATATVTGLTNGTTYTFSVTATNSVGTSTASLASNPATPEATSSACPCSIFGSATPTIVDSGDSNGVNLGVTFTTDTSGYITGVRFYKAAANTGTHVGSLWSATGALLAQAIFTNETASGWQQVSFSSPVPVTAGTTYLASYFAPNGHYSATSNGLASMVSNPPLYALPNSSAANGSYTYGSTPAFPTNSYNATNYWVDVVFSPVA